MQKSIKHILFLSILSIFVFNSFAQKGSKQAGVCFRIDDDQSIQKYLDYSYLFDKYGLNFCFALNLGVFPSTNTDYINMIKILCDKKNEMMDHTSNHSTSYFSVENYSDTLQYSKKPGVDHINGKMICLKIDSINRNADPISKTAYIDGNKLISSTNGGFKQFTPMAIYIQELKKIFSYTALKNANSLNPDTLTLVSFWNEPVSQTFKGNISYKNITVYDVEMNVQGIQLLFDRTAILCKAYGLPLPKTWIQPGGAFPMFSGKEVKAIAEPIGYLAAAVQEQVALQCFNEVNSDGARKFSMMGNNFTSENSTFKSTSNSIANAIAKHKVMISQEHFGSNNSYQFLPGNWDAYMQRTDSLLRWCVQKKIPVKTYKEWGPILYDSIPDPYQNVFPSLSVDLDENSIPDGYNPANFGTLFSKGGTTTADGFYINRTKSGSFCSVENLAGIEKTTNIIEFYSRGQAKDSIYVSVKLDQSEETKNYYVKTNSPTWSQQKIEFYCPGNQNTISVQFYGPMANFNTDISGIKLRKKSVVLGSDTLIYASSNVKIKDISLKNRAKEYCFPKDSLRFEFYTSAKLKASVDLNYNLIVHKPTPFWTGTESVVVKVTNPDKTVALSTLKFAVLQPKYYLNDTLKIEPDFYTAPVSMTVTSRPADPTLKLLTNGTYIAFPKVKTTYYTEGKYNNGSTIKDSLVITIAERPEAKLSVIGNNPFCYYDSVKLIANNNSLKTEWYLDNIKLNKQDTVHSFFTNTPGIYNIVQSDISNQRITSNVLSLEKIPFNNEIIVIEGPLNIQTDQTVYSRYKILKKYANKINWEITPSSSGNLIQNDSICDIYWTKNISGEQKLRITASDKCGSTYSTTLSIQVNKTTGLTDLNNNDSKTLTIFPNPVNNGLITIKSANTSLSTLNLKLYNLQGDILLEKVINAVDDGSFQLILSSFPKGFYLIQVENKISKILIL